MRKIWLAAIAICVVLAVVYGFLGDRIGAFSRSALALPESSTPKDADKAEGRRQTEGPPVQTATAAVADLPIRRRTIGTVISKSSLQVTSNIEGMVVERVALEGSNVKSGDVIVRLDSRTALAMVAKDKATVQRDEATLKGAQAELARQQTLASKEAVAVSSLENAQTAVLTAQATIALDQATLQADLVTLDQTEIRAPFAGRLGSYAIAVGSIVQPATAIIPLTELAPIDVTFDLPEADLGALRAADGAGAVTLSVKPSSTMAIADGGAGGQANAISGKLSFIDNQVDTQSGTFTAKATIDNQDLSLWPGQSVQIDVVFGKQSLATVPTVSVQPGIDGSTVYVLGTDGKVKLRKVQVGLSDGEKTGILSGLEAGERVVTEGQIKLADGIAVKDVTKDDVATGGKKPAEAVAQSENGVSDQ